jgi:ribosomal protein S18 acetylase RimI-like enzyme
MINYRLASIEDNQQLLELASSTGMSGNMALRIDRYPNFFELNKLRGKTNVYVALENDIIVGSICVSDQNVYINQGKYPLYYISDFKVAKTHRNMGIGLQLTNEVVKYLESQNADFAFLNVSKGNKRPFVFFSDRSHYPDFQNIGIFKTFQFIGSNKKASNSKYNIVLAEGTNEELKFLNNYYSKQELACVITKDKIKDSSHYVVRDKNQIIAVMCIIDTMKMKQNVVLKMPLYLKYFLVIINACSKILKISKLPKENEPIQMLYVKYLALRDYDKSLISMLISHAKQCAYNKSYSFVSLTLHEKDPLIKKLPNMIKFTFYSVGMLVSMKDSKELMEKIQKGVPFKDYSIV